MIDQFFSRVYDANSYNCAHFVAEVFKSCQGGSAGSDCLGSDGVAAMSANLNKFQIKGGRKRVTALDYKKYYARVIIVGVSRIVRT